MQSNQMPALANATTDLLFDASMAIDLGQRERQEDAVVSDFSAGQPFGFAVLADGMGGHAAGDVASKIAVTEVFSELKLQSGDPELLEPHVCEVLRRAATSANKCIGLYSSQCPEAYGMGATLLAPVFMEDRLYWLSVGDSPFYLFRNGELSRLNENHALISQIEYLVSKGLMSQEEALNHPDQNCLTSVLIGSEIAQVDCRTVPMRMLPGDILLAASDGLQFLTEDQIASVLRFAQKRSAEDITAALMKEVRKLDDPYQDNVSLCVVKVLHRNAPRLPVAEDTTETHEKSFENGSVTILARVTRKKKANGS